MVATMVAQSELGGRIKRGVDIKHMTMDVLDNRGPSLSVKMLLNDVGVVDLRKWLGA